MLRQNDRGRKTYSRRLTLVVAVGVAVCCCSSYMTTVDALLRGNNAASTTKISRNLKRHRMVNDDDYDPEETLVVDDEKLQIAMEKAELFEGNDEMEEAIEEEIDELLEDAEEAQEAIYTEGDDDGYYGDDSYGDDTTVEDNIEEEEEELEAMGELETMEDEGDNTVDEQDAATNIPKKQNNNNKKKNNKANAETIEESVAVEEPVDETGLQVDTVSEEVELPTDGDTDSATEQEDNNDDNDTSESAESSKIQPSAAMQAATKSEPNEDVVVDEVSNAEDIDVDTTAANNSVATNARGSDATTVSNNKANTNAMNMNMNANNKVQNKSSSSAPSASMPLPTTAPSYQNDAAAAVENTPIDAEVAGKAIETSAAPTTAPTGGASVESESAMMEDVDDLGGGGDDDTVQGTDENDDDGTEEQMEEIAEFLEELEAEAEEEAEEEAESEFVNENGDEELDFMPIAPEGYESELESEPETSPSEIEISEEAEIVPEDESGSQGTQNEENAYDDDADGLIQELVKREEDMRRKHAHIHGYGLAFAILATVFTAWQMSDNPDGIYAALCRLILNVLSLICKLALSPFRGQRNYYGHMPVSTMDYGYRDPSLELS